MFPLSSGKRETKFPGNLRKRPGQSRDSPGIILGQSRENFVYAFSCLLVFFPGPNMRESPSTITIMNCTSRCSSRCPSRCAIHYGYRAWTYPYNKVFFGAEGLRGGGKGLRNRPYLARQGSVCVVSFLPSARDAIRSGSCLAELGHPRRCVLPQEGGSSK